MTFADLSNEEIYDSMLRRDPELDGVVFVGVKTTGVYCRPVCSARIPLRKNVTFYPSAAAAEAMGFRPCRRCRPESASIVSIDDPSAAPPSVIAGDGGHHRLGQASAG